MKPRIIVKLLIISLLILYNCSLYPQRNNTSGLQFFNYTHVAYSSIHSTYLNLNPEKPFAFKNELALQYDFTLWNNKEYGLISYIQNDNGFYIALIYSRNDKNNSSNLILSINGDSLHILKHIIKNQMLYPNWLRIKMEITASNRRFNLFIDSLQVYSIKLRTNNIKDLYIRYGYLTPESKYPLGLNVADMYIRNIRISIDGNLKYYWPLDEVEGTIALDSINYRKAVQQNGEWLRKKHIFWNSIDSLEFDKKPGVAFDQEHSILYFITKEYITLYYLKDKSSKIIKLKSNPPNSADEFLFNPVTKKLLAYYRGGEGQVSVFNAGSSNWSHIDENNDSLQNYYFHSPFINSLNGDLLTLGGYGHYTDKNDLRKYDFTNKSWEKIKPTGDNIWPRSGCIIGYGMEPWDIYIFGGLGNRTGEQSLGFKELKDLYQLDLRNYSLKKLLELRDQNIAPVLYCSRMIFDSTRNVLYLLAFNKFSSDESNRFASLYGISISDSVMRKISQQLPSFTGISFYFDKNEKQLIAVLLNDKANKFYANIFSLLYPPENYNEAISSQKNREEEIANNRRENLLIIVSAILSGLLIFLWLFLTKYRKRKEIKEGLDSKTKISSAVKDDKHYNIRLFGEFSFLTAGGEDITYKFSPKLCELFLLLCYHSFNPLSSNSRPGISTDKLTNTLWPDFSQENAKNIRGVTISHLREILHGATDIGILYQDKAWRISVSDKSKLDLLDYLYIKERFASGIYERGDILMLINLFNNGGFLRDKSYHWLDPVKISVDEESIKTLAHLYERNENNKDVELLLSLSEAILNIDSVNETGLIHKLTSLSMMNQTALIQKTYDKFVEEYNRLYGEPFTRQINDLIIKKSH